MAQAPEPGKPAFDLISSEVAPGKPPEPLIRTDHMAQAPPWLMPVIRRTIWRLVLVVIGVAAFFTLLTRARGVVGMIIIALFFGIAMDPAVTWLHQKRGWKRGAATGFIFVLLAVFTVVMIFVLIPAIVQMAGLIADKLPEWIANLFYLLVLSIKIVFWFFMFAMVKAFVPRYRYDQLMRLGWKIFLPTSLVCVAGVAAWRVFAVGA